MEPTFHNGDFVIGRRWFTPKPGQVVVLKTPERYIMKRIIRMSPGQLWVEGDNKNASNDSRQNGLYLESELEALVMAKV
jgi:signal peptidase I